MRPTRAALLIEQGEHPRVIQARLGHSSIKTTLDTYGHLLEGLDQAAADRLDEKHGERAVGRRGVERFRAAPAVPLKRRSP